MSAESFLTICLNPTLQKTFVLNSLVENEVNRSSEHYLDVSGKGVNVSRVLTQLGVNVVHLTQAGGRNRELFLDMAVKDGIQCRWVESKAEIRCCYTLLNQANRTTTEIIEGTEKISPDTEKLLYREYQKILPGFKTVIISGTKAAGFSAELYPKMVRDAKEQGKIVILDLKGDDLINSLSFKPDVIKPNFSEFGSTFFKDFDLSENTVQMEEIESIKAKMGELYEQYGIITVLTRGKYGVLFMNRGNVALMPAEIIDPVNTIGCGDAFTAGLASVWEKQPDIEKAIRKGMECAKLNALSVHPGTIR